LSQLTKFWGIAKYPTLAAFFAFGIYGILYSYTLARGGTPLSNVSIVFWLSYFAMTIPLVMVIIAPDSKFWSRIGSLIGFALATSLPKIFRSIEGPLSSDEFGHLKAVRDIMENGSVSWWNSIVSPAVDFSVLHYFTAFVVDVTKLDLWQVANWLVIIFHILTLLGVFSLLRIKFSPRAAAVGSLIYATNPNWMFFHSRFAYETLALMLLFWLLFFVIRALESPAGQRSLMIVVSGPIAFTLSQTHHITFAVGAVLILLYMLILVLKEYKTDLLKVWTTGATLTWLIVWSLPGFLSNGALFSEYLSYSLQRPTRSNLPFLLETFGIMTSETAADELLILNTYSSLPIYEQIAGLFSPFILAAIFIYFWVSETKKYGNLKTALSSQSTLSLFANVIVIAYFTILPAVFAEEYTLVRRSWTYLLLGFSIMFTIFYERYLLSVPKSQRGRPPKWKQLNGLIIVSFIVLSVSSLANGTTVAQRYPINENLAGFSTSNNFNPELQNLAVWVKNNLPKNAWALTDRYTRNALVYPGGLNIAPLDEARFPYWEIFLNPSDPPKNLMNSSEALGVTYIVLNRFTFNAPTSYGYWFHPAEIRSYPDSEVGKFNTSISEALGLANWTETVWASDTYIIYKILWNQYEPFFQEVEE
jgi:hypothetical protein